MVAAEDRPTNCGGDDAIDTILREEIFDNLVGTGKSR
jgi:hypothetical protein